MDEKELKLMIHDLQVKHQQGPGLKYAIILNACKQLGKPAWASLLHSIALEAAAPIHDYNGPGGVLEETIHDLKMLIHIGESFFKVLPTKPEALDIIQQLQLRLPRGDDKPKEAADGKVVAEAVPGSASLDRRNGEVGPT